MVPHTLLLPASNCRASGVDVVTLGQYMRPTKGHMAVAEYVTPEAFAAYQKVHRGGGGRGAVRFLLTSLLPLHAVHTRTPLAHPHPCLW